MTKNDIKLIWEKAETYSEAYDYIFLEHQRELEALRAELSATHVAKPTTTLTREEFEEAAYRGNISHEEYVEALWEFIQFRVPIPEGLYRIGQEVESYDEVKQKWMEAKIIAMPTKEHGTCGSKPEDVRPLPELREKTPVERCFDYLNHLMSNGHTTEQAHWKLHTEFLTGKSIDDLLDAAGIDRRVLARPSEPTGEVER